MPPSILSELTRRNPEVNNSGTKGGANTTSANWPDVSAWVLWRDFNAETLYGIYKDIVDKEWRDPLAYPEGSRFDLEIFDEDSLEHNVISKSLFPPVNDVLKHARRVMGKDSNFVLNVGRSGRCYYNPSGDNRFHPDWSLVSPAYMVNNQIYANLLPGDTKVSKKWRSSWYNSRADLLSDPVRQVLSYCEKTSTRYGFIITDVELVVFRCAREKVGPGIGANRQARSSQGVVSHARVASGDTEISTMMRTISISSYQETDSGTEFAPLEYQSIPWANHGDGRKQLTVRLALFYLAMMAGYGPNSIQTEYPDFDSWYYGDDGIYAHNTSGIGLRKKPPKASIQYPVREDSGPRWVTFDGVDYITRHSVRTLDFDRQREQYFYVNQGNRVYIQETMAVFDETAQNWGHFRGLAWVEAKESEEGEQRKRRRKK